jgi:nucleotide-binding universal stress UspA family protein
VEQSVGVRVPPCALVLRLTGTQFLRGIQAIFTKHFYMKTFLVPTDFSPAGFNAAEYAAQLAAQFGARLILFHAYMLPTPVTEVPYAMATVDDLQKENEEEMRRLANFVHERYQVQAEQVVRIGVPSDEIREITREQKADLVIMGIKGAGGLDKIVGSTTTNTIRKIKTPVLVVPHGAAYRVIKDIVYATDFSYATKPELFTPLISIAQKFGSHIHILNVAKNPEKVAANAPASRKGLEIIFKDSDHEFVTVSDDSITHGISNYLQNTPAQLLAMVAHKHGFFERLFSRSQTASMAYETHVPLLVLQDKE